MNDDIYTIMLSVTKDNQVKTKTKTKTRLEVKESSFLLLLLLTAGTRACIDGIGTGVRRYRRWPSHASLLCSRLSGRWCRSRGVTSVIQLVVKLLVWPLVVGLLQAVRQCSGAYTAQIEHLQVIDEAAWGDRVRGTYTLMRRSVLRANKNPPIMTSLLSSFERR